MPAVGETFSVYLGAEASDPKWREGLVVDTSGEKFLLAMATLGTEKSGGYIGTCFSIDEKTYSLVTAEPKQLRAERVSQALRLHHAPRHLLRKYFALEEGTISCGTASD